MTSNTHNNENFRETIEEPEERGVNLFSLTEDNISLEDAIREEIEEFDIDELENLFRETEGQETEDFEFLTELGLDQNLYHSFRDRIMERLANRVPKYDPNPNIEEEDSNHNDINMNPIIKEDINMNPNIKEDISMNLNIEELFNF